MSEDSRTAMVAKRTHELWVVHTEVPTKEGGTQGVQSYYVAAGIQQVWDELHLDRLDEATEIVCINRVVPSCKILAEEQQP